MCSNKKTNVSTAPCSDDVCRLKEVLDSVDCVVIGAGAGLSTAAGYVYEGERFDKYFSDFGAKYGFDNMYVGGFTQFADEEEYWAYWSRYIYINRYLPPPKPVYEDLLALIKDKDYFVLTTNVDHCFQRAGFSKQRLFYTQGDYGLFQCTLPCCNETFDNEEAVKKMYQAQKNMRIPKELIPKCPNCGRPVTMNLRADDSFLEDYGWVEASDRYAAFLSAHDSGKVLYLELGVGYNTPGIIKLPFWQRVAQNPDAIYACINFGQAVAPEAIQDRAICINGDIAQVLAQLK